MASKMASNKTVSGSSVGSSGAAAGVGSSGPTRETYGKLNVSAIESATQLWLAQLPSTLAAAIDAAPEGTYLGTLTFTKGGIVSSSSSSSTNEAAVSSNKSMKSIYTTTSSTTTTVPQKLSLQIAPQLEETLHEKTKKMKTHNTSNSNVSVVMDVLPLDYTLTNITKQSTECMMHPFTRHPTNGSIELHGSIVRTLTVQMERTERYHEMCKSRIHHHEVQQGGKANVESIDTIHSLAKMDVLQSSNAVKTAATGGGAMMSGIGKSTSSGEMNRFSGGGGGGSGFGNSVAQFGKRLREAQQQQQQVYSTSTASNPMMINNPSSVSSSLSPRSTSKRPFTFTSESAIRTILFELFSYQPHWSLKDIRTACGGFKSDKEIRTELNLIGEYQRIGPMKGMWGLKTDFKDNLTSKVLVVADTTVSTTKDDSSTG